MLRVDAFEDPFHLLEREALVGLIIEAGDLFAFGVVANHARENADRTRPAVCNRVSHLVERDVIIADPAEGNRSSTGDGWQQVDAVSITDLLGIVDEISIDGEAHTLEEGRDRRITLRYSPTKIPLRDR
jgi:hypothetical protein